MYSERLEWIVGHPKVALTIRAEAPAGEPYTHSENDTAHLRNGNGTAGPTDRSAGAPERERRTRAPRVWRKIANYDSKMAPAAVVKATSQLATCGATAPPDLHSWTKAGQKSLDSLLDGCPAGTVRGYTLFKK